jgi:hypothetical protein
MLSLNDRQLETMMTAASSLPVEKRGVYLERVAAHLNVKCGSRFSAGDVATAAQKALASLIQRQHSA